MEYKIPGWHSRNCSRRVIHYLPHTCMYIDWSSGMRHTSRFSVAIFRCSQFMTWFYYYNTIKNVYQTLKASLVTMFHILAVCVKTRLLEWRICAWTWLAAIIPADRDTPLRLQPVTSFSPLYNWQWIIAVRANTANYWGFWLLSSVRLIPWESSPVG